MQKQSSAIKKVVQALAEGSTCPRAHVGAVLLREGRIIASGYNGSLPGKDHCDDVGCVIKEGHCIATVHAEANCIAYCAKHGIVTEGCTLFVSHSPCRECTKLAIMSGINRIIFIEPYRENDNEFKNDIEMVKE